VLDFDPFSSDVVADPYGWYEKMRTEEPVHWSDRWGVWVVARYADVRFAFHDDRLSARHNVRQMGATEGVDLGLFGRVPTLPSTDPPLHTRLRRLINRAFTPSAVEALLPRIEAAVDAMFERVAEHGEFDVVRDVAGALPIVVIGGMLGLPLADARQLKEWTDALMVAFEGGRASTEQQAAASEAASLLADYFRDALKGRSAGTADLLERLMAAAEGDDALSNDEIVTTSILLLIAGNETTTGLMANGTQTLLDHPVELERLFADPTLVPLAVDEMLRFVGPVQMVLRTARQDIGLSGTTIPAGDGVALMIASANRDEEQFPAASNFRIDRSPNDHLAFGLARHFCLGAPLARLEVQIAMTTMLEKFTRIESAEDSAPVWGGSLQARRVTGVRCVVTRR
jgi:cytochrome P450